MNKNSKNHENIDGWLSIEETAKYLGMGKTVLYSLAREGRIPASKVGKKWIFEKDQLDTWLRANQPMSSFFTSLDYKIADNEELREPQREAYLRTYDFFQTGKNKAILQIPVGCGKSGLAAILPLGVAKGRVLILAPNLSIRKTLYEAMDITNRQKCFWRKAKVLAAAQMVSGPLVCTLETGNISVAEKAHIIITNIHQLATNVDKWLTQFPDKFFGMIIVDEAHHSAADSWKKVLDRFPEAKVIHMTATPFRSDRQEIDGELVYRYSFRSATLKGYIKRLKASYVAPKEIELSFTDGAGKKYTLDQVLKMKEEDWFSRNIALAKPCNQHIVDSSLEKLEELRQTGTRHQIIAVACTINHAKDIRAIYRERGYNADIIHSKQKPEEQEEVLRGLYNGTLDCIIQVQMLGEGFDHPKLSVAAIFRPFRTLAPYVQFVGRIMRVVVQNYPGHPDNLGHIITHLGMNLDQRVKEFKQFENDDQAFWDKVVGGEEPEVPSNVRDGSTRLTASENDVVVNGEIVDSLWEEDFADMDEKHIIDDLKERLKLYGLDPEKAEEIIKNAKRSGITRRAPTEAFPIQPQKEWEELKRRVSEQGNRLAKILLNNIGLDTAGMELAYKYTSLKARAKNNLVSAIMLINHEINARLGKDRSKCSAEEFKVILDSKTLDGILQTVVRRVHKAKNDYEKSKSER
ncbi:MAG: DEAD/DEAH box helicase family protein [Candidatus Brocadia sp.]|nr:DEAD/DEAH box helicase family protein [Candidatus Brocadia sp.]